MRALLVAAMLLAPLASFAPATGSPAVELHAPIAIVGDVGPNGLILGYDANGDPVYNPNAGIRGGRGTPEDPYVISGWRIVGSPASVASAGNIDEFTQFLIGESGPDTRDTGIALRVEGTTAHLRIANNQLEGATPLRLVDVRNVAVEANTVIGSAEAADQLRQVDEDVGGGAPIWFPVASSLPPATGIEVFDSANVLLRGNAVSGAPVTILVADSSDVVVDANVVDVAAAPGIPVGVLLQRAQRALVSANLFEGAADDYGYLIRAVQGGDIEITGHDTSLGPARDISLQWIEGGRIHDNTHSGIIEISESSNVTADHNTLLATNVPFVVYVARSTAVRVVANDFQTHRPRIQFDRTTGGLARDNNLHSILAGSNDPGVRVGTGDADLRGNWWGCVEGPTRVPNGNACSHVAISSDASAVYDGWLTAPNPLAGDRS